MLRSSNRIKCFENEKNQTTLKQKYKTMLNVIGYERLMSIDESCIDEHRFNLILPNSEKPFFVYL